MNSIELNKLINLLQDVNDCKLDIMSAETVFEEIKWEALSGIKAVFANLYHFWQDEDIRNNDPQYKAMQESELEKLIGHLKNEEWSSANGVSFLDVSDV